MQMKPQFQLRTLVSELSEKELDDEDDDDADSDDEDEEEVDYWPRS